MHSSRTVEVFGRLSDNCIVSRESRGRRVSSRISMGVFLAYVGKVGHKVGPARNYRLSRNVESLGACAIINTR